MNQNKRIKHLLVCCGGYPTKENPVFPFVEQIVNEFARNGIRVSVVAPQSLTKHFFRKEPLHPRYRLINRKNFSPVEIFQPYTVSFGRHFVLLNRVLKKISLHSVLRKIEKPDVCYGHFWYYASALYDFAKKNKIPLFVASGEASIKTEAHFSAYEKKNFLDYYKGVFFASTKNKKESEDLGFLTNQKNIVIPNAIDPSSFYLMDKQKLREKYSISQNFFIVVFVGSFIQRKGPNRVASALKKINDSNIKAFFIGREHDGVKLDFDYEGTILKGVVEHDKLVDYLNMADVFVLPTLAEGCCNAMIEALACGLPIISSDLSFNDDVLDDSCSIRINPESIDELAEAIKTLSNNPFLCKEMGKNALKKASSLTIEKRANTIVHFMESLLR